MEEQTRRGGHALLWRKHPFEALVVGLEVFDKETALRRTPGEQVFSQPLVVWTVVAAQELQADVFPRMLGGRDGQV